MTRRSLPFRIVLLLALAGFVSILVQSAGHVHAGSADNAVKTECRLCSVGQARTDLGVGAPRVAGLIVVAWCLLGAAAVAPSRALPAGSSPRAPPVL